MAEPAQQIIVAQKAGGTAEARRGALFHPLVDFFCLGGGSLLILPLLVLPLGITRTAMIAAMLTLANFVNHPHFAHSYQIFYRGFAAKAFSAAAPGALRARYLVAGIAVPVLLGLFFAISILARSPQTLAVGLNLMSLLVGWHYVKQGYGMAIVDSVLKRSFYSEAEKTALLVNSYACWILGWFLVNRSPAGDSYWGIKARLVAIPDVLYAAAWGAAVLTSAALIGVLVRKAWRKPRSIAVNGLVAYLVTLYLWVVFIRVSPLFVAAIPALHSLQYLLVVWRYKLNEERGQPDAAAAPDSAVLTRLLPSLGAVRVGVFVISGLLLGFVGFWALPLLLDATVPYDRALFGNTLFVFVFWIFINVHHYFLDNVMWRRENPDTRKYLFGR